MKLLTFRLHCSFVGLLLLSTLLTSGILSAEPNQNRMVIDIIARRLSLYDSTGQLLKNYPVGVGRSQQYMTPLGNFQVLGKTVDPGWVNPLTGASRIPPGSNNPLGTRWIGFYREGNREFGIHGTNREESVGRFVSHGCVRMKIADAEELFEYVEEGSLLSIVYNRYRLQVYPGGDLALTLAEDPYGLQPLSQDKVQKAVQEAYPEAILNQRAIELLLEAPLETTRLIGYLPEPTQN